MTDLSITKDLFFSRTEFDHDRTLSIVSDALNNTDDGELYLEYRQTESISLDDGRIRSASFNTSQGFGLRSIIGETAGYAHASTFDEASLRRAAETVNAVRMGHSGTYAAPPIGTNQSLYTNANPVLPVPFDVKN